MKVKVIFYSMYGHVYRMAEAMGRRRSHRQSEQRLHINCWLLS